MIGLVRDALRKISKRSSRRNLYEWLAREIAASGLTGASRTINVGAGGDIADRIRQSGLSPTSVDIDPARKPDVVADIEHLAAFEDGTLDAVFLMEVLEHVRNPAVAVAELRRVLRPGGVVIGSTPFLLAIHDEPHDYYRFTFYGLQHLFRDFEHVLLRERNGEYEAVGVLATRRLANIPAEQVARTILLSPVLLLVAAICSLLDRLLPSVRGTTGYFFVFRKPL